MNLNNTAVNNIIKFREEKRLTQKELAKAINMSPSAYNRLEKGEVPITLNKLYEIVEVLDIKLSDILGANDANTFISTKNKVLQQGTIYTLNLNLSNEQFEQFKNLFQV